MTISVADARRHGQRLVLVVKMATVLGDYTTEEKRSVLRFCGQMDSLQKNIHKEMFPVYGGKYLSRTPFASSSRNALQDVESRRSCQTRSPCCDCDKSNCAADSS
jgi:hypothetical protein